MPPLQAITYVTWSPHPAVLGSQFFAAAEAIQRFNKPLEQVVTDVVAPSIKENFDAEGRPPWVPLADATLRRWPVREQILVQTGLLRSIATSPMPWTIDDGVAYLNANKLGDAYYGVYHERGTRWMPARPWAPVTATEVDVIVDGFADWAETTIAEVGLWGRAMSFITRIFRR